MPSKIKKRGENSYLFTVSDGYNADGSQRVYTKTVQCDTIAEVENEYTLFAADCLQGKVIAAGKKKMTLSEFYDYWKHHHAEQNHEATTLEYNENLFIRIKQGLGHLKIDKITVRQIMEFIDQLKAPDAGHGNKPLSNSTIAKHITLLKTLFNYAVRWDFVIRNPMTKIQPPKQEKHQKKILDEDEMAQFLSVLSNDKKLNHRLWVMLAFSLGLRREEIFGLQWKDINFDKSIITIARAVVYVAGSGIIEKDTKSTNSHRTLSIPPDICTMLQQWKNEVVAGTKRRNKRRKVVEFIDPTAPDKWVFAQPDGSVRHPHSFNTFIRRFCENNGLKDASPHLLRHMMGSYLLKSGQIDLAAISQKLGHSSKSFTANTYIHALESTEKQSANVMQGILDNLKNVKKEGQAK
ncbi:tyrosine-type recombinase/integrase [Sporomusa acidovorans]|uniref:Tyrosine recombinase XerC n=1 Tax=Sporomusa acidovorans (strain ATCC 49682 / DSM 3132 / Mol) TaxID=1123286 RepID=A0ABZ3J8F9_SPOA4|nr:tyrosine-type recombinase/integrase [Sporomusa acidovorans]OZC16054.1 tyrosine recombinase XerC [Sporomusa acidovorans DSM 3132]SDD88199.1 Phage integrase, N-terminal SAM-like domain [Sporomusa acidovorans]